MESRVEASLSELETSMATVWQHYREHVTGLPDLFLRQVTDEAVDQWQVSVWTCLWGPTTGGNTTRSALHWQLTLQCSFW